nr:hypothetical protein [uncultured Roseateles sp.]
MISTKFSGYRRDGRRVLPFDLGGDAPPPPDYTPVANASAETARLSAEMGQKQLDEAKRQYDNNMGVAKPIVDAQLAVMQQGLNQGQDYFDYMKSKQRPVEDALQADALKDNSGRDAAERNAIINSRTTLANTVGDVGRRQTADGMQFADNLSSGLGGVASRFGATSAAELARMYGAFGDAQSRLDSSLSQSEKDMREAVGSTAGLHDEIAANSARHEGQINADIGLFTSGNDAIRAKYGTDIENDAALAVADARAGQSNATNAAIRQAMRYGLNTSDVVKDASLQAAQAQAAAANGTRVASTNKYREVVGQGIGMRQNLMSASNQAAIAAANAQLGSASLAANAASTRGGNALSRAGLATNSAAEMARMGLGVAGQTAGMDANGIVSSLAARKDAADKGFASELSSSALLADNASIARDMRVTDDARNTAQKMDVAGLYRNMPGASAGAYGLAINAGNSANANNMGPGQSYMQGMNSANSATLNGRQIAQQGLTGILNAQTDYAKVLANQDSGVMGAFGTIAGSAITAF